MSDSGTPSRNDQSSRRNRPEKKSERASEFTTVSGYPIRELYSAGDLSGWEADRDLGFRVVPVYAALRSAIDWFRAHGYAPPA